jgi:hypothetical protein
MKTWLEALYRERQLVLIYFIDSVDSWDIALQYWLLDFL